jgi:addiction module HigA family antidote
MLKDKEPPHPGEILLREFIEPNGLMPHRLAKDLGWPYSKLEKLMDGELNLSIDSAMELAEVLDMEPEFWVNLQSRWSTWKTNQPLVDDDL